MKKIPIKSIIKGSIAEEMEIEAGDYLLSINSEEIKDILRPNDFEPPMIEINSTGLTNEMLLNWDTTKVTDMSGLFKDFK